MQSHWGDAKKGEYMGKTYVQTRCDNCGKVFSRQLGDYNRTKHHFCNQACQAEYRHNIAYEDRSCKICGSVMHVAKRSKQRFCSNGCQAEWQKVQVGELNPRFNRVSVTCTWCGKEILEFPCKVRDFEHHFCDEKCRRAWYAHIWSQQDEWKKESRLRAVDVLASGVISFTKSAPQVAVNAMLDKMDVGYINEYDCKYFAMDNYLTQSGLMIEVMGDFWHTNPIVYQRARYEKQIDRIKSDRAKQTYVLNQYGVRILYLWEKDIKEHPDVCKSLIKSYIDNKGQLENYHSFNYHIEGEDLMINDDLIVPFFEQRDYVANAQSFGS